MIALIGAMQVEVERLISEMTIEKTECLSGLTFNVGTIYGQHVVVAKCGVGKVNAGMCTEALILKYNPDIVINLGVAGSLNPNLKVNDIVVPSKVAQHDFDLSPLGDPRGMIDQVNNIYMDCDENCVSKLIEIAKDLDDVNVFPGIVASGDQFIASEGQKNFISSEFNADLAEMEAAAIGQVCVLNNVPFAIVRSVSDNCNDDSPVDFPTFVERAVKKTSTLMFAYLKSL